LMSSTLIVHFRKWVLTAGFIDWNPCN